MSRTPSIQVNQLSWDPFWGSFSGVCLATYLFSLLSPGIPLPRTFFQFVLIQPFILIPCLFHEHVHALVARLFLGPGHTSLDFHWYAFECRVDVPMTKSVYALYSLTPLGFFGFLGAAGYLLLPGVARAGGMISVIIAVGSSIGDIFLAAKALTFPKSARFLDHGSKIDVLIGPD